MGFFSKLKNLFKRKPKQVNQSNFQNANDLNNDSFQNKIVVNENNGNNNVSFIKDSQLNVVSDELKSSNNINNNLQTEEIVDNYNTKALGSNLGTTNSKEEIVNFELSSNGKDNQNQISHDGVLLNSELTKQKIEKIINSSNKFKEFVSEDIAKDIFYSLKNVKNFDFEKELKFINNLLTSVIVPWSLDLDKKFKELFMIYFFEKSLAQKKIKDIIVPIFNNINIDWNKPWKQSNKYMSVCFDFAHKFGNNFQLCTMKDCKNYYLNKMNGNIVDTKENFNYLIARAGMTENLYELIKENENDKDWANNSKIIGLLGEYYIANKLLYGKPTSTLVNNKDFFQSETYDPDNLEYIERICDGFNKNKYLLRKMSDANNKNISYHKPDVFKLSWMRIQDQYFSDNDFIVQYPIYSNNSINPKGTCTKSIEVKSTKKFYEYLPEATFDQWVNNHTKENKYWKDCFKLTLKEFANLKKNEDYTLLRVYGIDYDFSSLKSKPINNKNDLEGLFIKHITMNDIHKKANQRVVVIRMDRYYLLRQILAFFNNFDLFCG